jgi:quercetin dioxygenase-like cupin family protein
MSDRENHVLRPAAGGMLTADIVEEIKRLKSGPEWRSGDRHAVSLVKDEALNILLLVLKKGAALHEHRTKGPIAVQIVSGSIRFRAGSDERGFSNGQIVALDRGVAHSLEALEESALIIVTAIV